MYAPEAEFPGPFGVWAIGERPPKDALGPLPSRLWYQDFAGP